MIFDNPDITRNGQRFPLRFDSFLEPLIYALRNRYCAVIAVGALFDFVEEGDGFIHRLFFCRTIEALVFPFAIAAEPPRIKGASLITTVFPLESANTVSVRTLFVHSPSSFLMKCIRNNGISARVPWK